VQERLMLGQWNDTLSQNVAKQSTNNGMQHARRVKTSVYFVLTIIHLGWYLNYGTWFIKKNVWREKVKIVK
jgi:hypothetical protein